MRTFYIFKINNEFTALTRNCPYNLFKSMEKIYYTDKKNLNVAYNVYEQIVLPFKKDKINVDIFENYKDNDHYTKFNIHMINNFYNDEQTKLIVNSSHMILKTTVMAPSFFNILRNYSNIFVCDFENKDYFWLESVLV